MRLLVTELLERLVDRRLNDGSFDGAASEGLMKSINQLMLKLLQLAPRRIALGALIDLVAEHAPAPASAELSSLLLKCTQKLARAVEADAATLAPMPLLTKLHALDGALRAAADPAPAAVASALELGKMLSEKLVKLFAADVTKALVQTEPLEPHFHAHLEGLLSQLGLGQPPAAKEEEAPPPPPPPMAAAADAVVVPTDIPTKPTPVKPRRTTRHSVAARAVTPPAPSPKASGTPTMVAVTPKVVTPKAATPKAVEPAPTPAASTPAAVDVPRAVRARLESVRKRMLASAATPARTPGRTPARTPGRAAAAPPPPPMAALAPGSSMAAAVPPSPALDESMSKQIAALRSRIHKLKNKPAAADQ